LTKKKWLIKINYKNLLFEGLTKEKSRALRKIDGLDPPRRIVYFSSKEK